MAPYSASASPTMVVANVMLWQGLSGAKPRANLKNMFGYLLEQECVAFDIANNVKSPVSLIIWWGPIVEADYVGSTFAMAIVGI